MRFCETTASPATRGSRQRGVVALLLGATCAGSLMLAHGAGAAPSSAAVGQSVLKTYQSFSGLVTKWPGPTNPVKVVPGKTLTVITCGSTGITCVRVANGVKAAAATLGYTTTVVDGQQSPTVWNQAIMQAIANKTSGIVLAAVSPTLVQGALQAAAKAGIPVAATLTPEGPGPVTRVNYDEHQVAQANAAFIAVRSKGKAQVLQIEDYGEFPDTKITGVLYAPLLSRDCHGGCQIAKQLTFTAATAPTQLPGNVAQALESDPAINYIIVPFDTFNQFVIQGVTQARRTGKVKIIGLGGDPTSVTTIKQGAQEESLGTPAAWMGWAAVDGLLRAFAGQKQEALLKGADSNYNIPMRYVTAQNLPTSGGWESSFNYEAKYRGLWKK